MNTRNTRYWRHFLQTLLSSDDGYNSYDGVSFFTASGVVEYRDGCFSDGSVALDPLQLLSIFDQLTRQAIQDELRAHQTATKAAESVTPALRLGGSVFHVVSSCFSSLCAVSSGQRGGLVVEKLPFGFLLVVFSSPLRLESVFRHVDEACVALRR